MKKLVIEMLDGSKLFLMKLSIIKILIYKFYGIQIQ